MIVTIIVNYVHWKKNCINNSIPNATSEYNRAGGISPLQIKNPGKFGGETPTQTLNTPEMVNIVQNLIYLKTRECAKK